MGFYSNFLSLCNSRKKTPSKVVLEIGMKKSAVTRWKAGGKPTDATAQKIAAYFGVSVSELTGEKEKPAVQTDDGLSDAERRLIELLRQIPEDRQAALLDSVELALRMQGLLP